MTNMVCAFRSLSLSAGSKDPKGTRRSGWLKESNEEIDIAPGGFRRDQARKRPSTGLVFLQVDLGELAIRAIAQERAELRKIGF